MKIVELNGGLGNQICQYIFARYLEVIYGFDDILLDTLHYHYYYYCVRHNGFELDLFPNIKFRLLKDNFDKNEWDAMVEIYKESSLKQQVPYILNDNGMYLLLVLDEYWFDSRGKPSNKFELIVPYCTVTSDKYHNKNIPLHEEMKKYDNVYYKGVWITDLYCNDIKEHIVHELKFPPLIHQENIDYCKSICSSEISVGLHIRLGDFIDCNKTVHINKYSKNLIILKRKLEKTKQPKPNFFIFSDDITWCKENTKNLGFNDDDNITFIEGNHVDVRNYIDMQLMTYCDYLIYNHKSSFCLAATMISEKNIIQIPVK